MKKKGKGVLRLTIPKRVRVAGMTFYLRNGQVIGRETATHEKRSSPLFCFHEMYATEDSFCANANSGIRQICQKIMGPNKEENYIAF